MKIIYFATYYKPYLISFYSSNIGLNEKSFDEQFKVITEDYFGSFISYHNWTIKSGHQSNLIIANCEALQKKWAEENNFTYSELNWQKEIALEQIKEFNPDIFYIGSMFDFYGDFLKKVRQFCKNIFGWISCPIPKNLDINKMDLLFSSAPHYVENFRKSGIKSELVTAGFDPILLNMTTEEETKIPFSFTGGFSTSHSKRINTIRALMEKTDINIYGYNLHQLLYTTHLFSFAKRKANKRFTQQMRTEIWGLKMYQLLKNSKITFNSHINMANGAAVNMRMYEATGMGSLLLTDGNPESNIFEDGKDVVYYTSIDDAVEKADYYLNNEAERAAIAKSGQKKTLDNFSYEKVTKLMLEYFIKYRKD
jgi:spore maturation protein CgeB